MEHTPNNLSCITLAGHKTFREYLLEKGKAGFSYSLDQFEHELKTYSLRKDDTDKVVTFFQELMNSLETEELNIRTPKNEPPEYECPFCSLKGKKFPEVNINFKLGFLKPLSYVTLGAKLNSDSIYLNLEDFKGSQVYLAWEKTLSNLQANAPKELKDGIKREQDDLNRLWFEAETNPEIEVSGRRGYSPPSLDEIIRRTLVVADAVQKSYLATQNLPKLHEEELNKLSERLLETT